MSAFTGDLTMTQTEDWRVWRLGCPLRYEVGEIGSGRVIEVPTGFESDGTSIPRVLWALLPAWGKYSRAAVMHDFTARSLDQGEPHEHAPTYRTSDAIFHEALGVCGVNSPVRFLMWAAVRLWSLWTRGA